MVTVILVRHGETDWNRREIFRGRADVDLNDMGRKQARALAAATDALQVDAVYSSPLNRALQTAHEIAKSHDVPVQTEHGFIDFDYGIWQGLPHREVKEHYPSTYNDWLERPHTVRIEEGESLAMVRKRAMNALRPILARHERETVVLLAHRVVNKVILCAVLGLDNSAFWHIRQDTCALNIFEWSNGQFIMRLLNDTCHLKNLPGGRLADF